MDKLSKESDGKKRSVFTSSSFVEKASLLVLSGMIVPIVMVFLNSQFKQQQKYIETQKAEIISSLHAKRIFWNDVSKTILTVETLALDVSWFQTSIAKNDKLHKNAFERYNDEITDLIVNWRVLISRASTLSSPRIADELNSFLGVFFIKQDTPIIKLVNSSGSITDWDKQHAQNEIILQRANELVAEIAIEMGIEQKLK